MKNERTVKTIFSVYGLFFILLGLVLCLRVSPETGWELKGNWISYLFIVIGSPLLYAGLNRKISSRLAIFFEFDEEFLNDFWDQLSEAERKEVIRIRDHCIHNFVANLLFFLVWASTGAFDNGYWAGDKYFEIYWKRWWRKKHEEECG